MRRGAILVALATGLARLTAGCGGSAQHGSGDVVMTVTLPDGVLVPSATYVIDDEVSPALHGTVNAAKPAQELVKALPHVPAGDAYVATVQAQSLDGQRICDGSTSFKVTKGATTRVEVLLTCAGGPGQVVVGIGVSCRETPLVAFVVSPLEAPVGAYVIGRAAAARPDGGSLTFSWSAPSGTFATPTASQTTFTCTQPGPVEVTLKVQDDEECQQSPAAIVTCLDVGDGGQDGGQHDGGDAAQDAGQD